MNKNNIFFRFDQAKKVDQRLQGYLLQLHLDHGFVEHVIPLAGGRFHILYLLLHLRLVGLAVKKGKEGETAPALLDALLNGTFLIFQGQVFLLQHSDLDQFLLFTGYRGLQVPPGIDEGEDGQLQYQESEYEGDAPAERGNVEADIQAFLDAGIDGLFIDQPDIAVRLRQQRK